MSKVRRYYRVTVKTGHQGTGRHGDAHICVKANDAFDAMRIVRNFPGVKSGANQGTPNVVEITEDEHDECRAQNKKLGYMRTERNSREGEADILRDRQAKFERMSRIEYTGKKKTVDVDERESESSKIS